MAVTSEHCALYSVIHHHHLSCRLTVPNNFLPKFRNKPRAKTQTDTKLLTCLFATHHAQQLKTRPDPAHCILCCASVRTTALNTRVKNPHREPPPIACAHCTAIVPPIVSAPQFRKVLGCVRKGRFAGFTHGVPAPSTGMPSPLSAGVSYFLGQCFALF